MCDNFSYSFLDHGTRLGATLERIQKNGDPINLMKDIPIEAEHIEEANSAQKQDMFAEIYFAQVDIPTIGRNLLGDSEYNYLMSTLKTGEHAVVLMGKGYSFKGSGYVRGAIFDRIQILQIT